MPVSALPDRRRRMLDIREGRVGGGPRAGAVHIPMGELPSQIEELPLGDGPLLAVVCR